VVSSSIPAAGHDPIYLNYGSVKGEVTAKAFAGDIQLSSFQWGVSRTISLNADGTRQISLPAVQEIAVGKSLDSTSLALAQQALGDTAAPWRSTLRRAPPPPARTTRST